MHPSSRERRRRQPRGRAQSIGSALMPQSIESDIESAGDEAGLAISEIVAPQATEALRKAECRDIRPSGIKTLAPRRERSLVTGRKSLDRLEREAGQRRFAQHDALRRQHAAGKDILLDKIRAT